jgi:hypothetical protein
MSKKNASMRDVIAQTSKSVRSGPPALRRAREGSWNVRTSTTGRTVPSTTAVSRAKKASS